MEILLVETISWDRPTFIEPPRTVRFFQNTDLKCFFFPLCLHFELCPKMLQICHAVQLTNVLKQQFHIAFFCTPHLTFQPSQWWLQYTSAATLFTLGPLTTLPCFAACPSFAAGSPLNAASLGSFGRGLWTFAGFFFELAMCFFRCCGMGGKGFLL